MNGEHPPTQLPGYLHFTWMFFMQPVSLHRRLRACGIEPDAGLLAVRRKIYAGETLWGDYLKRLAVQLFVLMPALAVLAALLLQSLGMEVDWKGVAFGVAFGVAVGVAFGVAVGVAFGVAFGVAVGVAGGVAVGVAGGVAFGVAFPLFFLRIPLYLPEALLQFFAYRNAVRQAGVFRNNLHLAPVLHHELSYLPHPFLGRHILLAADHDPALARHLLAACAIAPGQRRTGRIALAKLQARETQRAIEQSNFAKLVDLNGEWLPSPDSADPLFREVRQIARELRAVRASQLAYHRLDNLKKASDRLRGLENQLLSTKSHLARALRDTLPAWHKALDDLRHETESMAADQLPNPFRGGAGDPLTPDRGPEVFRGRTTAAKQIERLLASPDHSASIALLGPRRCGKTSLLKMLPTLLPDALCVFFDLQDNTVDSTAGFFQALSRRTQEQARDDRRLELPAPPPLEALEAKPFETATAWLDSLEAQASDMRILICIDEFERLESLFPGDSQDLLRLMSLFRATIQHKRKVRLLVAGEAPFHELGALWNDHFINLREVKIGHLDQETSRDLLHKPIPEFPGDAIPMPIAERIYQRTGGQPYLLQLYGQLLVEHLNDAKRKQASPEDVEAVEEQVLEGAVYYLRERYTKAPDGAKAALEGLAAGKTPTLEREDRRWLRDRWLIDAEDRLTIPVLGRWIREEG